MVTRARGRRPEPPIVDIATETRAAVCLRVAAAWLGLSRRTIQSRIESGALEAERDGRKWFVPVSALRAYREARRAAAP